MPTSIDPPPGENEFECARCGAHVYVELTRCPNCGVNLYEPDDILEDGLRHPPDVSRQIRGGLLDKVSTALHRLTSRPYRADEVFGDALNQAGLYDDLLRKVGGDPAAVERLVDYERRQSPQSTRMVWLQNAIQRWEDDNQSRVTG